MRGEYLVTVANNRVKFKLNIRRNLTILQGNSATGKTTLLELIDQFDQLGPDSGVSVVCDAPCHVLSGRNWKRDLKEISSSIVFIDEDSAFMRSHEFAHAARESDNYYVLVARESLPQLRYSVDEIYGLKKHQSGNDQVSRLLPDIHVDVPHLRRTIVLGATPRACYRGRFQLWI